MIRAMLNLRCKRGHRWYSPEPREWEGHDCGYVSRNGKTCAEPLVRTRRKKR